MKSTAPDVQLLRYPYRDLHACSAFPGRKWLQPGDALVWEAQSMEAPRSVSERPGGLSLIVILPEAAGDISESREVIGRLGLRPHGVLPPGSRFSPEDLAEVLRRPSIDLAADATEYLRWRGIHLGRGTVRLVRNILDLSADLRSVAAASRSLYVSRRALGRHMSSRGLPVPSHWLQIGRLLRVLYRLQNTTESVGSVGLSLGYPDGFSLSNQMERLTGHRPSLVRERFGWEWFFECWLRREASAGNFGPSRQTPTPYEGLDHTTAA